ncbi:sulfurtransferase [Enterovibrio baiacu]|uniref:sulfurtransferase n=1 Tax=Enterovibrio baiacu TaxID=2491023 RepID=UPI001010DA1C|nr:rhodanese-like domain-containing protein [Enterovibrio baiacu]MBE1273462.1 sulfurtransferase [Enterovibrio baiacu]
MSQNIDVIVNVDWLKANVSAPNIKTVDASWFMPGSERNGAKEWETKRIPGAVYFDFDGEIKDKASSLPHMLPSTELFAESVSKLGIANTDTVVVYDSAGIFSSPRVWWMFKVMGHQNVALLDGGLPAWENAGGDLDTTAPIQPQATEYTATFQPERYIDRDALLAGITENALNVIDVRPFERFSGSVAEPREGVRSGHMPNAVNLPFPSVMQDGFFKSSQDLTLLLATVVSNDLPNVTTCGSGVTACTVALASEFTIGKVIAVYDGSWTEWGGDHRLPIEVLQ